MKKRIIYLFSLIAISTTTLTSCEDYLDINRNPNAAEKVDPKLLFSTASTYYVNLRSSGDLFIPMALAGQSIATGGNNPTGWGIPSEEQYNISPFFTGNTWRAIYTNGAGNLTQAIQLAESATPVNNNAAAQAKVLKALMVYDITTIFGDVPYSEAWNLEISYPKFDPQQQVLEGIISLLDEAIAQFDPASPLKIADYDIFYKGDLAKWTKLAKSAKLRTLMTMVDKDPSKAAAIGQMLTAGGMISSAAENLMVNYETTAGRQNPKYQIGTQYNGGQNFFFGNNYVIDFMNTTNDPRRSAFFTLPAGATTYVGVVNGEDASDAVHSRISPTLHRANAPEFIFTYDEQLFFEAEIHARGLGVPVNLATATTLYKKAVEENAKMYGIVAGSAAAFAATLPDLSTFANNRAAVKYIHMHHWVAKMDRGLDAFTQWRRSGPEGDEVPNLILPVGAPAGGLIRSWQYPATNEISANPSAPQEVRLITQKLWFDI